MHLGDSVIGEFGAAKRLRSNGAVAEAHEAKINVAFLVPKQSRAGRGDHDR
jgi:hypothetical protein